MRYAGGMGRMGFWLASAVLVGTGLGTVTAQPAAASPTPLIGTFTITAGSCTGGTASGTYLRMVLSGGSNAAGPYFSNSDSSCPDNSYTPLSPGSSGGLVTGAYQPEPSPAFDSSGNALAHLITAPVAFEGVKFATATNAVDPQTGLAAPAPSIAASGTALSGNLESFGVSWNKQQFNQGSPKPGGASPGNTVPVSGTYDPATGAYTLQWSSQVVGGPFNGFSACWNLTGKFIPAASSPAAAPGAVPGQGSPSQPAAVGSASGTATAGGTVPPRTAAATDQGSAAGSAAQPSGTTTSTAVTAPAAAGGGTHSRVVLSSRTITSGGGGWRSPGWLVVLFLVLALMGLAGVLRSEQVLRHLRSNTQRTEGGTP